MILRKALGIAMVLLALCLSQFGFPLPVAAALNQPPLVGDISVETDQDSLVSIHLAGRDLDGTIVSFSIDTPPDHGTVPAVLTGPFVDYEPDPGFVGADSFFYRVTDNLGASATGHVDITVVGLDLPPVYLVSFDASPTKGEAPLRIDVADTTTNIAGAETVNYSWNFGEGTSTDTSGISGAQATHVYARPGTYLITLVITDALGRNASASKVIHVTGVVEVKPFVSRVGLGGEPVVVERNNVVTMPDGEELGHAAAMAYAICKGPASQRFSNC